MATKKFKCKVCGYIHEGDAAPEKCPVCQAPASEFEEIMEEGADKPAKKGLNTDGNTYTIIYSCIVVIIVAFLLAFVSKVLEPQSMANVRIDKKSQILAALNLRDVEKADVENTYAEVVVADEVIDKDGNVTRAKQEATGGAHDDLVMAWAAFYIVRQQQRATPIDPEPKSKKGSFRSCITTMGNANAVFPEARKPTQNEILNRSIGIKW